MTAACILGCAGPQLTPDEIAFFREAQPWGFIVFARNIQTPYQTRRLTAGLREAVGWNAPVLIDQEGGRVQRMRAPHWREWLPPLDQVARATDPVRSMYVRARIMADELLDVGIDVNCAPSCDVARADTHPFLRNRCYGEDPAGVTKVARAVADGFLAGGVLPVMKHMPGHGRGTLDSHYALPHVTADADALEADFAPFRALSDLPMAMTAHIVFTAFDDAPATQSKTMIGLMRAQLGFEGLLMTDDISMEALGGDVAERSAKSIAAGCDLVLHCNGDRAEMEACVAASGRMSDAAAHRGRDALAQRRIADKVDITALEAEIAALLNG